MKPKSHIAILLSASLALALGACSSSSDDGPPRMMLDLTGLTPTEDWTPGTYTIQPGDDHTMAGITADCPADGEACVVTVTDDGDVYYTGGKPALMAAAPPPMTEPAKPTIAEATMAVKDAIQALEDAGTAIEMANTRLETATTEVDSARTALATTEVGAGQDAAIAKLMGAQADLKAA